MDERYTLDEARQIIHREATAKICAVTGHDLKITFAAVDRAGGAPIGVAEPMGIFCKYCYQTWDVVRRG